MESSPPAPRLQFTPPHTALEQQAASRAANKPDTAACRRAATPPGPGPRPSGPPPHASEHGAAVLSCRRAQAPRKWRSGSEAAAQPAMVTCSSSPASPQTTKPPAAMNASEPGAGAADSSRPAPHVRLRVSWKGRFVQVRGQRVRGAPALVMAAAPLAVARRTHPTRPLLCSAAAGRGRLLAVRGWRPLPGEPARIHQVRACRRRHTAEPPRRRRCHPTRRPAGRRPLACRL